MLAVHATTRIPCKGACADGFTRRCGRLGRLRNAQASRATLSSIQVESEHAMPPCPRHGCPGLLVRLEFRITTHRDIDGPHGSAATPWPIRPRPKAASWYRLLVADRTPTPAHSVINLAGSWSGRTGRLPAGSPPACCELHSRASHKTAAPENSRSQETHADILGGRPPLRPTS